MLPSGLSVKSLEKLGVLVIPNFLSETETAEIRDEMRRSPQRPGALGVPALPTSGKMDETRRKSRFAQMSKETRSGLSSRIKALKPQMESFFDMPLAREIADPAFLMYNPGDFFRPHRDRTDDGSPIFSQRRVNVIIALNRASSNPGPDDFGGSGLSLYGLIEGDRWNGIGFPVNGNPGDLLAFRSTVIRGVAPIEAGERLSLITYFMDPSFDAQPEPPPGKYSAY